MDKNTKKAEAKKETQPKIKEISEIDKYIKMMVLGDAMQLMLTTHSDKKERRDALRLSTTEYGCWQRLRTEE